MLLTCVVSPNRFGTIVYFRYNRFQLPFFHYEQLFCIVKLSPKRVHAFYLLDSRERFGEVNAKTWWEENRERIQAQYL